MHGFIKLSLVISGSVQVQIMFAMVRISDKNILAGNKVKHLASVNHIKKTMHHYHHHRHHHHNLLKQPGVTKNHVGLIKWMQCVTVISENTLKNMKKRKWSCKPLEVNDTIHVQSFLDFVNTKEKWEIFNCDFFAELSKTNNIKHIIASNFISNHHEDDQYTEIIQNTTSIN